MRCKFHMSYTVLVFLTNSYIIIFMFLTFQGSEQVQQAAEAALTFENSAVVVRGLVADPIGLQTALEVSGIRREGEIPAWFFPVQAIDSAVSEWRSSHGYSDQYRLDTGIVPESELGTHVDSLYLGPFVMSVSFNKIANWQTQRTTNNPDVYEDRTSFYCEHPVDEFNQEPGDAVIVPAGTIHRVDSEPGRTARVFNYMWIPKRMQH